MLDRAEFSRRAAIAGLGAAMAASASPVRAAGSLSGFHNVRDYGAKGDGRTIDSPAFNRAIEAANRKGGGTIVVPPGRYLCFSIRLKSHITLVLMPGSVIEAASPDRHKGQYDLPENAYEEQFVDYGLAHFHNSLIYGDGISDVAIVGHGLIHGLGLDREGPPQGWHGIAGWKSPSERGLTPEQARRANAEEMKYEGRGNKAIGLTNCRNVLLKDFSILQGGHFACYVIRSTNVRVEGLTVDTDRDGIDIDGCRDVRVVNCTVNAPKDDAIVLKSSFGLTEARMCEDVQVIGCKTSGYLLGSLLDGTYRPSPYLSTDKVGVLGRIKLGTDSVAGFRNVLIADCICENTRGLQLGAIDGGVLEDVTFRDINLINPVNHPIFLRLSARNRAPKGAGVAKVRRVRFTDIQVSGARMEYPCGVVGIPDGIIEDVSFRGVHVRAAGGGSAADAARDVPERRTSSLEPSFMGILLAHGLYARHVRNLAVTDCGFDTAAPDARPTIALENVQGAVIDRLATAKPRAAAVRTGPDCRNVAVGSIQTLTR
ncbi:rhamnogalacturonidase [Sphingomonas turrisvirgatae]|uniref:Glycoside hydrolase n=1 Tax=Sphingomonas turrisvirgatae TaxID=1888892 RepID=A0A1E3M0Q6_9SPHN|nr:glycosyl hydrolase family 28-related protein [Sphingomonas turrisvirgatae]ODP39568.1 glycoside hydrolase [Sphingomonas turrisvirgatae]